MVIDLESRLMSVHDCQLGIIRSETSGVARAFKAVLEPMETCSLRYSPPTCSYNHLILAPS